MRSWFSTVTVSAFLVVLCGCPGEQVFPNNDEIGKLQQLVSLTQKAPADPTNKYATNVKAAALGNQLFHDVRLSGCGTISCASCHAVETGLSVAKAKGCPDKELAVNPPTLFNTAWMDFYMWNGRADRLWNQAILPMTNPDEMAATPATVRALLTSDAGFDYPAAYSEVFGKSIDAETDDDRMLANVGKAIAAYETIDPKFRKADSTFDTDVARFLVAVGQNTEEQDPAWLGLKVFVRKGVCVECHKTARLSDSSFHNVGLSDDRADVVGAAKGLPVFFDSKFNAAGEFSDARKGDATNRIENLKTDLRDNPMNYLGAHKTPTLRGIKDTAPYMHNGKLKTLEEVVDFYNKGGDLLGTYAGRTNPVTIHSLNLTAPEKAALIRLLESM